MNILIDCEFSVERMGHRQAHAPILEIRGVGVPAEVSIHRTVIDLVVERPIVKRGGSAVENLVVILRWFDGNVVKIACAQAIETCGGILNHTKFDRVQIGRLIVIILVPFNANSSAFFPLDKAKWPGADRVLIEPMIVKTLADFFLVVEFSVAVG